MSLLLITTYLHLRLLILPLELAVVVWDAVVGHRFGEL